MADAASAQQSSGQPSQEELQAYLQQMQAAEPAEIVAQAFQILAMGAEVKIGRSEARVLIDSLAGLTQAAQSRLPDDLSTGMQNAVRQLQMAQVQAEQAQGGQAEERAESGMGAGGPAAGHPGQRQPAGDPQPPGQQPPPQQGAQQQGGQQGEQSMTDRLWIPGR